EKRSQTTDKGNGAQNDIYLKGSHSGSFYRLSSKCHKIIRVVDLKEGIISPRRYKSFFLFFPNVRGYKNADKNSVYVLENKQT
ncbi:hypothetical protein PFDG_05275, partial [Plasmodium falciparum Dd2]